MTVFSVATKQKLVSAARCLRLLPLLEFGRFRFSTRQTAEDNRIFLAQHTEFEPPPQKWMHDMYSHTSYRHYHVSGRNDADTLLQFIDKYAVGPTERIVEWGCGLARVLQHFPPEKSLTGFDYNEAAIDWATKHIPQARFYLNKLSPPLEMASDSADVVYAISVFTHLSEAGCQDWAAELFRILRPGGLLLVTVHGRAQAGSLLPAEENRFDAGHIVTRGSVKEGSRIYSTYHPDPYVQQTLLPSFSIVEGPLEAFGQTLWIAQKPE